MERKIGHLQILMMDFLGINCMKKIGQLAVRIKADSDDKELYFNNISNVIFLIKRFSKFQIAVTVIS